MANQTDLDNTAWYWANTSAVTGYANVPPDGPSPCNQMIVGEAPAREEVKQGKGFVGPSGRLLWPLLNQVGIKREQCYVTNLSKMPLDNDVSGDAKMTEGQFLYWKTRLEDEVATVRPSRILAVGTLAAKALLDDRFTNMKACNGSPFIGDPVTRVTVYPTWHPAAALRGGGEDKLAWTFEAIKQFAAAAPPPTPATPPINYIKCWETPPGAIAVDTEGTPRDPICLTWAADGVRAIVYPHEVHGWWRSVEENDNHLIFHNAPWDWAVMEAMGILPHRRPFTDTMELAYVLQTEPQGLKDLAWRHLRYKMKSWEDVVMPHWEAAVTLQATGRINAGTMWVTHSPKTGKPYKRPKEQVADEVKPLKRALKNPKLLAQRMNYAKPSLRFVPSDEMIEYATTDAWATLEVFNSLVEVMQ